MHNKIILAVDVSAILTLLVLFVLNAFIKKSNVDLIACKIGKNPFLIMLFMHLYQRRVLFNLITFVGCTLRLMRVLIMFEIY